jgi:hypothetical protein
MHRVLIDLEASFVDDDLMVEPAEEDQVVLVGAPALTPGDHMVGLESVSAGAAVGGAGPRILVQQRPA